MLITLLTLLLILMAVLGIDIFLLFPFLRKNKRFMHAYGSLMDFLHIKWRKRKEHTEEED